MDRWQPGKESGVPGRFDLIRELYNLETDRTELQNLAAQHPEKVRELAAKYDAWAQNVGVVPWELYRDKLNDLKQSK